MFYEQIITFLAKIEYAGNWNSFLRASHDVAEFSDSDEPLLSGSGQVNRVCSEDVLAEWKTLIEKWKEEPEK